MGAIQLQCMEGFFGSIVREVGIWLGCLFGLGSIVYVCFDED